MRDTHLGSIDLNLLRDKAFPILYELAFAPNE
jgi:hypothetical protein